MSRRVSKVAIAFGIAYLIAMIWAVLATSCQNYRMNAGGDMAHAEWLEGR